MHKLIVSVTKLNLSLNYTKSNKMNKKFIEEIQKQITEGDVNRTIIELNKFLFSDDISKDVVYYLLGNAYRKLGSWKEALNNYQYAIDINPMSPAKQARAMVIDIMNFYNKDMFNH